MSMQLLAEAATGGSHCKLTAARSTSEAGRTARPNAQKKSGSVGFRMFGDFLVGSFESEVREELVFGMFFCKLTAVK